MSKVLILLQEMQEHFFGESEPLANYPARLAIIPLDHTHREMSRKVLIELFKEIPNLKCFVMKKHSNVAAIPSINNESSPCPYFSQEDEDKSFLVAIDMKKEQVSIINKVTQSIRHTYEEGIFIREDFSE